MYDRFTLKNGEPVVLSLKSEDVAHGTRAVWRCFSFTISRSWTARTCFPLRFWPACSRTWRTTAARNASLLAAACELNTALSAVRHSVCLLQRLYLSPDSVPEPALRCQLNLDFKIVAAYADAASRLLQKRGYRLDCVSGDTWEFRGGTAQPASMQDLYKTIRSAPWICISFLPLRTWAVLRRTPLQRQMSCSCAAGDLCVSGHAPVQASAQPLLPLPTSAVRPRGLPRAPRRKKAPNSSTVLLNRVILLIGCGLRQAELVCLLTECSPEKSPLGDSGFAWKREPHPHSKDPGRSEGPYRGVLVDLSALIESDVDL